MTLDAQTKIKLLISLISDEGYSKLEASLDKLLIRLSDGLEQHREAIVKYIVQA